ncbi:MAG: tyrosine-type recombinase/integrase, partial [Dongiaceae bacterium]
MPALTRDSIRKARSGDRERILWDRDTPGFGCRILPGGSRTFFLQFRAKDGDRWKNRRMTLGHWQEGQHGQVEAMRRKASKLINAIREGGDPVAEAQRAAEARSRQEADTVVTIGEKFIAKHAAQRRWGELERVIRRDVIPAWGTRPVADITRRDVMDLLDTIAERAPVQANRTLTVLSIFFGWCAYKDIIPADPTARVKKPTKEEKRERLLNDDELRAFWRGCDRLGWPFGPLLQLLALTAQRKSEIGNLRWDEINDSERLIELAGERYKTGRTQTVPLSDAALAIIKELPRRGDKSGLVFTTNDKTPVSGFSKAKAELDGYMIEELRRNAPKPDKVKLPPWIIHDLRRTARTNMTKLGIPGDVGERVLGHVIPGIRGVYDRYEFLPEKRGALDRWAAHLVGILTPALSNVLLLNRAR